MQGLHPSWSNNLALNDTHANPGHRLWWLANVSQNCHSASVCKQEFLWISAQITEPALEPNGTIVSERIWFLLRACITLSERIGLVWFWTLRLFNVSLDFLQFTGSNGVLDNFLVFLILFNYVIPVSLYVTVGESEPLSRGAVFDFVCEPWPVIEGQHYLSHPNRNVVGTVPSAQGICFSWSFPDSCLVSAVFFFLRGWPGLLLLPVLVGKDHETFPCDLAILTRAECSLDRTSEVYRRHVHCVGHQDVQPGGRQFPRSGTSRLSACANESVNLATRAACLLSSTASVDLVCCLPVRYLLLPRLTWFAVCLFAVFLCSVDLVCCLPVLSVHVCALLYSAEDGWTCHHEHVRLERRVGPGELLVCCCHHSTSMIPTLPHRHPH